METHAKCPALYANGVRMMAPAIAGSSHVGGLFGVTKTSLWLSARVCGIHHGCGTVDYMGELGVGQQHDQHEYSCEVDDVSRVSKRIHARVVENLASETGQHCSHSKTQKRPIEPGTSAVRARHPASHHEKAPE